MLVEAFDVHELPAGVLATHIRDGRLSSRDVVEAYLQRIARADGSLGAFVEVYGDDALLAAERADNAIKSGLALGFLHGVPVAVKDIFEMAGRVTTGGAGIWRARHSVLTATVVSRLISQGMIVIGKTHTVEFALGGWGTNRTMGTPRNPWDPARARTPGGSSSGSGVAVAAGLAPWAIGSDTGGSVRIPSAWCGVSGLKTTIGRVSCYGVLPLSPTFDTPGPIARNVEDLALLYAAIAGPDPADPRTLHQPLQATFRPARRGVRGLRLGRMPESERAFATADVIAAYDRALDCFAELGAEIVQIVFPCPLSEMAGTVGRILSAEAYSLLGDIVENERLHLDEDVRPRILAGRDVSATQYLSALRQRERWKRDFDAVFAEVDALLTPTLRTVAIPIHEIDQTTQPSHFTRFANLLDLCAMSIPNGFSADGLPIGLQIVCPAYEERVALHLGRIYQQATDWHSRRPPEWTEPETIDAA
jgi:aspartyl-tRNA(Asn)/glutamyl-tRNA(Gln) amidotransferase subunit A